MQNKIDTLKEIEDQENKELEKQEKLLAIEEARIKLANAQKNKTVAVLRKQADGTYQNEYIADQDAIDEARDELTQAELDYNEYINQLKIETLEEQIEALRREQEEKKNNYDKQLDDLEKWYNDQEDYYEEYYDDLDKLTYEFLQKMRKAYNDDFAKIIEETQKLINSIDVPHGSVTTGIGGSFIQGSSSSGNSSSNSSSISGSSNGIYAGMTDAQKANEIKYLNSIINNPNSSAGNKIWAENQLKDLYGYAEGGVATYTGLAKLHGTPNNPEVIFNAKDAQKLYDLIHYNLIPIPRFNNNWQFSEANKGTGVSSITIEKVEFPNATNSNEIKDALLSLPRVVLQY